MLYQKQPKNRSWIYMIVILAAFVFIATIIITSLNQLPEGWVWIGPPA